MKGICFTALASIVLSAWSQTSMDNSKVLRFATWNLGWHIASDEVPAWIAQCNRFYVRNPTTKVWELKAEGVSGARRGWNIAESRATLEGVDLSVMPPCNVYRAPNFRGIAVTQAAYSRRTQQIARVMQRDVRPDVIAFQEVSGTKSVTEALGATAGDYHVCSFDGKYKVQRLAFAWRKQFGPAVQPCQDVVEISLPNAAADDRVRPAYSVVLNLNGKKVRLLTVHLKSSCVSPLDKNPRRLDDEEVAACAVLQQQVAPLEETFERLGQGVDHFVVLGDFNRNLAHELNQVAGAEAQRSDGVTDLTKPMAAGARTRNLLHEINDGQPPSSQASLLMARCAGTPELEAACVASKTGIPTVEQQAQMRARTGLGCRNPIGLDFVLISQSLLPAVMSTDKIGIGQLGRSRSPTLNRQDPLLAVSDHCPLVAEIGI